LSDRLQSLRADFGADLKRLAPGERKTIDSSCGKARELGRQEYVTCLSDQLLALSRRRNPAGRSSLDGSSIPPPSVNQATFIVTPATPSTSRSAGWWIGGAFAALLFGGGGVFFALRSRRPTRTCKVCGVVLESGELCSNCRHEAAELLRHGAIERLEKQQAQEANDRQREREEEPRQETMRQKNEAGRPRQEGPAFQEVMPDHEEERRLPDEEERHPVQAPTAPEEALDPHVVLGVPEDASQEAVLAAYEEAKAKYAPDLVADMPAEVQAHFRAKGEAVERAYQTLAE
jgi:DnaJ-domain-containing protein 1